jgi:hypothetical protein
MSPVEQNTENNLKEQHDRPFNDRFQINSSKHDASASGEQS